MRGKTAIVAALAAGSLAFWAAGCGGGDATTSSVTSSTSTATTAAVSTEEFITAADARCAEANAAIANLASDGSESATTIQQQLDITEQTVKGLKSLGTPDDPDGSLADYYDAVKTEISVLGQQQDALASGDSAAADTLSVQLDQAQSDAQTAADSFGFKDCGQQGTAVSSDTSTGTPSDSAATTTPATPTSTTTPAPAPAPTPVAPAPGGTSGGGTSSGGTSGGTSSGGSPSGGISPSG